MQLNRLSSIVPSGGHGIQRELEYAFDFRSRSGHARLPKSLLLVHRGHLSSLLMHPVMRPHILARRLALLRKRSFIARPLYASASPSSTHNAPFLPVGRSRWIPQTRNYAVAVEKEASDEPEVLPITTPVPGAAFLQRDLREIYAFLDKEIGGTSLWRDRIRDISEDLRALRRGRIASEPRSLGRIDVPDKSVVLGESLAVPHDVVTAMLQDPLNHSKGAVAAIQSRYQATQPDVLRITSDGPNSSIGTYSTDSPFLQNAGYDIMEISPTAPDIPSLLLSADATVVVVDPIRLLDSPFMTRLLPIIFAGHPLHIVVNGDIPSGTSPSALQDVVQSRINQWLADSGNNNESNFNRPRIFFVHADKALHAINFMALGATQDPSSSTDHARAVALYQTTFAESNLGPFLTSLVAQCRAAPMPQLSSAYRLASLALDHARSVIMADRRTTDSAGRTVAELRRSARQSISRARHMSVITKSIEGGIIAEGVETEMTALKLEMQERFKDRWSWLALVLRLRVDDVGVEVGGHVQQFLGSTLARTVRVAFSPSRRH